MIGVLALVAGASIGSFLNVVIDRVPAGRSLLGRSHCDSCGRTLQAKDLVPMLSYLWLKGHCRYCNARIPIRVPAVEGITALLFFVFFLRFGATPGAMVLALAASLLLVLAVIDLERGLLPDSLVLPGMAAALGMSPLWPLLGVDRRLGPLEGALGSTAGALGAGASGLALFAAIVIISRGGMGWGDVKLAGLVGLLTGVPGVVAALWIAIVAGGCVALVLVALRRRRRHDVMPFGPFLSLGGLVVLLADRDLASWYAYVFWGG